MLVRVEGHLTLTVPVAHRNMPYLSSPIDSMTSIYSEHGDHLHCYLIRLESFRACLQKQNQQL